MTVAAMAAGAPQAAADALLAGYHAEARHMKECASLPAPLPGDCVHSDSRLTPALDALNQAQRSRPSYWLTHASEYESFLPSKEHENVDRTELEAVAPNFGDKPLIVLTRGTSWNIPGIPAEQNAAIDRAWKAGHDRLAALSTRGSNTVVPGSGHYIQYDQPQAVIDAVTRALTEIRGR